MFNILHDSIFNPRALVKQTKRSGFFVFLYLLIMALFMTIGAFVYYLGYENTTFDYETTGCQLVANQLVCDGENYDPNGSYYMYGVRVFFLDQNASVSEINNMGDSSLLIQGDTMTMYLSDSAFFSRQVFSDAVSYNSLSDAMASISSLFLIANIFSSLLSNIILILAVVLISSLMFLRYRKQIFYRKIFKLVTFAITPVALLITFYNLMNFNQWVFFIIAFFAYRSLFILNRELYVQSLVRSQEAEQQDPSIVDSYPFEDVDARDAEDEDDSSEE